MKEDLVKLANYLNNKGLEKEAEHIDVIIKKSEEGMDMITALEKADSFAKKLRDATLGPIVVTKDPGMHPLTPVLKTMEWVSGWGTAEQEVYDIFKEIKELESKNKNFTLKSVARKFKILTNQSLFEVLKSELEKPEIDKLNSKEYYEGVMEKLKLY